MMAEQGLSVLIFGAGAIGTYIGGSLASCGNRVVFLERREVAAQLRTNGLRIQYPSSAPINLPPSSIGITTDISEALADHPFDAAIFALKSFDTASAISNFKFQITNFAFPILCLSNGVENEAALAEALGPGRVIAGTVTSAIGKPGAGEIVVEKARGVGIAAGHALSSRLASALNAAGLNARLYPRAGDMKWSKLLSNLIANTLSAILDMTSAEVYAHPGLFRLEMAQMHEALQVMAAQGFAPVNLPKTPVRLLAWASRLPFWLAQPLLSRAVGKGRGDKMPSFHIDLHSGRGQSEVDYLNGAVARFGQKFSVPAPVNRALTELLLALTAGTLPLDEYAHQPEKLLHLLGFHHA